MCVSPQDRQYRSKRSPGNNQAGINDDGEFFSNVTASGNLCDDEKLRPSLEEEGDDKNNDTTADFNDDHDDDNGFKKQLAMETFRSCQRKKEVSFAGSVPVAEEGSPVGEAGSPVSHTYSNSGSFGLAGGGEKGEFTKHPHALLNRQVRERPASVTGRNLSGLSNACVYNG